MSRIQEHILGHWMTFDAAHRLTQHAGRCKNLHGHTYRVEVMLSGTVNQATGMIMDFGLVKSVVNRVVDEWDHAVLLSRSDPLLGVLTGCGLDLKLVVLEEEPTVEHMVFVLSQRLSAELRKVEVVSIRIYETPECWAELRS